MHTQPYGIPGPWPGRLAIMPRPRGGDWLEDETKSWRQSGINVVVSLLTSDEIEELNLDAEGELCHVNQIEFVSFPIEDRGVPSSMGSFKNLVSSLGDHLANGRNVVIHCRQGIGRAGLVAIALLVAAGVEKDAAVARVSSARGCLVPETSDQRQWINEFSKSHALST